MRIANRAGAALLSAALLTLIFVVWVFLNDSARYKRLDQAGEHLHQIIDTAQAALSALSDAETGQRGFIITGRDSYLEPYRVGIRALDNAVDLLTRLVAGNAALAADIQEMATLASRKKGELAYIIQIYRSESPEAARQRVLEGRGKVYMDQFRELTTKIVKSQEAAHRVNTSELMALGDSTRWKLVLAAAVLFLFTLAGTVLLAREIGHEHRTAARLDVSQRKYRDLAATLEHQVELRTESLRQVNDELTAFSYSVSHDLRAPLRSIDGFSQIILEDYGVRLDEPGRNMLERIRAAARHMSELIQSLLELSRVTRLEPERQLISLSEISRAALDALATNDPQRHVDVHIAPALIAHADPQLIRVVMNNLLANAWKFTSHAPEPRIEVGKTERDGKTTYFVRDNGAGFDAEHADRLFTPFQRFHSEKDFDGTGIGLATVQRVIHRHGGRIWAESRPGEGATFHFTVQGA